jgi:hypothetical protein
MIKELKVSELVLYDKNPRKISDENFEKLKRDLQKDKEFLKKRPVLNYCDVIVKRWEDYTREQAKLIK